MSKRIAVQAGRKEERYVIAYTEVDDDVYAQYADMYWTFTKGLGDNYVSRSAKMSGIPATHLLHRLIMGLLPGDKREVEHLSGDVLDNRRVNLAIVSHSENVRLANHRRKIVQAALDMGLNLTEEAVRAEVMNELGRIREAAAEKVTA